VKLRLYGFRLTPDQLATYSRYPAASGTFFILFGVSFCFGGGLQKTGGKGKSLSLMWCGCCSWRRGMRDKRVSHTDGSCGDSGNRIKMSGIMGVPVLED